MRPEPYEGKLSRTVLRRERRSNPPDLADFKVMGEKGDEEQLLAFLNAVLKRSGQNRLVSVEILENKTFTAEVIGDKSSILDIRAVLEDQSRVNIEVQLRNLGNMDPPPRKRVLEPLLLEPGIHPEPGRRQGLP